MSCEHGARPWQGMKCWYCFLLDRTLQGHSRGNSYTGSKCGSVYHDINCTTQIGCCRTVQLLRAYVPFTKGSTSHHRQCMTSFRQEAFLQL